jgi:hypothetical protein
MGRSAVSVRGCAPKEYRFVRPATGAAGVA